MKGHKEVVLRFISEGKIHASCNCLDSEHFKVGAEVVTNYEDRPEPKKVWRVSFVSEDDSVNQAGERQKVVYLHEVKTPDKRELEPSKAGKIRFSVGKVIVFLFFLNIAIYLLGFLRP